MIRSIVRALAAHPRFTAFLGALSISFSGVLYLYADVSSETAAFYRCFWGLPIIAFAAWYERRERSDDPMPRKAIALAAVAGLLFAGDLIFWHHTIDAVGAGLATVLGNLQVVIVAIAAWMLFGERPSARTLVALPIVLGGVVLIAGVLGGDNYGADPTLGVILGVLTAMCYAGYLLIIRQMNRRWIAKPVAVSTASSAAVALAIGLAIGSMELFPGAESMFWLIVLGVTAQSLGYLFISISLPRLPAVVTSIILLAQPVLAVLFAIVLVGESPSPGQYLGVAMVIGGIALATIPLGRLRRRAAPAI